MTEYTQCNHIIEKSNKNRKGCIQLKNVTKGSRVEKRIIRVNQDTIAHNVSSSGNSSNYYISNSFKTSSSYNSHNSSYSCHNSSYNSHNSSYNSHNSSYNSHNSSYNSHNFSTRPGMRSKSCIVRKLEKFSLFILLVCLPVNIAHQNPGSLYTDDSKIYIKEVKETLKLFPGLSEEEIGHISETDRKYFEILLSEGYSPRGWEELKQRLNGGSGAGGLARSHIRHQRGKMSGGRWRKLRPPHGIHVVGKQVQPSSGHLHITQEPPSRDLIGGGNSADGGRPPPSGSHDLPPSGKWRPELPSLSGGENPMKKYNLLPEFLRFGMGGPFSADTPLHKNLPANKPKGNFYFHTVSIDNKTVVAVNIK